MAVTAENVDLTRGLWILTQHKTATKTGKRRVIVLSEIMLMLTRNLMEEHPTGSLFRNTDGEPWSRNAVRCRMQRLRKKLNLPVGTVAYSYRHSFATRGLSNDVSVAKMAELLGHSDVSMLMEHYSHLGDSPQLLRQALATISKTTS